MEDRDTPLSPLPSAIASASHIVRLHHQVLEHEEPLHGHASTHHQHISKNEHFRRLEDRMDELHREMIETQRMVRELTIALYKTPTEAREHRSTLIRQNFRSLSGKALLNARGPPGSGPPSSIPVVTAILSAMDSSTTKGQPNSQTDNEDGMQTPDLMTLVNSFPSHRSTQRPVPSGSRKLSASNPVALMPERLEKKHSVSMAVAHAAAFVAEVSKAANEKKSIQIIPALRKGVTAIGPILSRRFSMSSLDQSGRSRGSRLSRVFNWSRNIFKQRVEPTVSPEDILDARSGSAKIHPLTINHNSVQRMIWDTIVIIMIVVDIVVTPLSLSFRYSPKGMNVYNAVGNTIFATDFVINMLSSYTTPRGVLISGPRQTVRHYLLSPWSLPDFLSWFPFEIFVSSDQGRFLGFAKVIRLVKVSQLARRLHSAKKAGFFRSVKLLGTVFIVSHVLSCYWNWIARDWRKFEDGYLEKTLGQQYAHCWSLVIGSLNASPPPMYSTIEEVSVAIFMLVGNVLQATVFGSVAVLIQSFDEEEVAYNKKLITTYERCRFLDIPEKLARRIQGYYENLYQETRSVNPDADAFINELSPALICEVKFQLYRDMIKQIPFLSATHINPVVIEMLILHLRTVIYMQDDVLIRKGEVGDWMGFIGSKGSVGVLDPKSEIRKIIRILRKGDYFGEMALLQRAKRSTTAIALTWVQIHVLCRNDLDDVKDQYPQQAEILEEEITKYMQSKVTYK